MSRNRSITFLATAAAAGEARRPTCSPAWSNKPFDADVVKPYRLNSGDLEAFLTLTAEDIEFTSMVAEADGTVFRGHAGVRAWWETVRGAFEDVSWEALDFRGSGDRGVIIPHVRNAGQRPRRAEDVAGRPAARREGDLVGLLPEGARSPRSRGGCRRRRCRRRTSRSLDAARSTGSRPVNSVPVPISPGMCPASAGLTSRSIRPG